MVEFDEFDGDTLGDGIEIDRLPDTYSDKMIYRVLMISLDELGDDVDVMIDNVYGVKDKIDSVLFPMEDEYDEIDLHELVSQLDEYGSFELITDREELANYMISVVEEG